ncbi:hypothetical protein PS467_34420 [Streptomyces luomodiensis]|uniref:Uncharacterized protein n=1 Tax=Streptomyces luomodiensis TaxID=3026192 RepID=A0ABY9V592_9ACTN|nr:hypothetical protein [Streptomyces sp. SCA4-21]WNF00057.1 hypothetical protein PS467_34420 [Streptomyces sp. SCA4-21]
MDQTRSTRDARVKFESADLAARAVALRGWAYADEGLDVVGPLLGAARGPGEQAAAHGAWISVEKPDPAHALGPVRSVVVLTTTGDATVSIAHGGQAWRPAGDEEPPAWTVRLGAGAQVVVDGRAAYRLDEGEATARRWTAA